MPQERFDPNDPAVQILLLAQRVETLGREKEGLEIDLEKERMDREIVERKLEKRIAAMESSFQRGAGMLIILPILGTVVGVLFAYGKFIFGPWTGRSP